MLHVTWCYHGMVSNNLISRADTVVLKLIIQRSECVLLSTTPRFLLQSPRIDCIVWSVIALNFSSASMQTFTPQYETRILIGGSVLVATSNS